MSVQSKLKHRALRNIRGHPQPAVMGLDDRAANRQSHPHAIRFRGEERVENPIDMLRAESCPAIGNRIHYAVAFLCLGFDA